MQEIIDQLKTALGQQTEDARRLFHGRGQCYPGLEYINVDWFKPVMLITLYQAPPEKDWQALLAALPVLESQVQCALVQHRYQRGAPIDCLWGQLPQPHFAKEQGLQFQLQLGGKQNFGFFLDMAPGRQWLRERSVGKRVLNLFSYTCSLSVAAIAGAARSVVNVDMSKAALAVGRDNHRRNGHEDQLRRDIQFLGYDIFRSWKRIIQKGPYDIVVIDPPSRQKGSFIADKDYVRVIRRLPQLLAEGGEALVCLNAPELGEDFLKGLMANECPQLTLVQRLANRDDFPERDSQRNLKMLHYRLAV